jgi:hypothetical protein
MKIKNIVYYSVVISAVVVVSMFLGYVSYYIN